MSESEIDYNVEVLTNLGFQVIDISIDPARQTEFFYEMSELEPYRVEVLPELKQRLEGLDPERLVRVRYDIEYKPLGELIGNCPLGLSERIFYNYYSPLQDDDISNQFGVTSDRLSAGQIVEVGAGPGNFLRGLDVPNRSLLKATELSVSGMEFLFRQGIFTLPWRLEDMEQIWEQNSIIYLSYFIDRDSDQKATLMAAAEKVQKGGLLLIEGWLPVNPIDGGGNIYALPDTLVTEGESIEGDVILITEFLNDCGSLKPYKIGVGKRLVYSCLTGKKILPTTIISFIKK